MMKKIVWTYGCITGLVISAMVVVTFSTSMVDMKYGEIVGYTTMIIAFSTIFFAIKSHRDHYLDGSISFWEALKLGLGITIVATVIYVTAWFIISNTIAQDFMAEYFQHSIDKIRASGLLQAEIDKQIADMKNFQELYKNPIVKIGMTVMEIFPVGLIISLISAAILKKK
jgi:hypothetical protein